MARQPLFGAVRMESRILGRVGTGRVLVLDLHEIVAGKIVALFDRGAARDLFDVRRILAIEGLDRGWIKAAVPAINTQYWPAGPARRLCARLRLDFRQFARIWASARNHPHTSANLSGSR